MEDPVLTLENIARWDAPGESRDAIDAVESGGVLYLPRLAFALFEDETRLLRPDLLADGVRNISFAGSSALKGVAGGAQTEAAVVKMMGRFRAQSTELVSGLFPAYAPHLRLAPTSLRPKQVSSRRQSVRADDRRLHVDAFPTRPNRGERILRVFTNINPHGESRVWRVGEPFEDLARRYLPRAAPYSAWKARALHLLHVTKSLRSEYDHLMLQLHDLMKADEAYQRDAPQRTVHFAPGTTWVCFSDHTLHAAMSGQFMLEQTFHLPVAKQYDPGASPLAILTRLTGHALAG
ncbi:MAG TPA: Kdo hydroxylase family protein [Ramlibacter sp.]|uniref:Kdo hydroxylase family protein n=1 Tax=Ramlibacter sp. TaxID=1917967 RepID=UPI002BA7EDC5|nr:Kdo hydroxylase family protein [Ramlibacter sp.]HVZ43083.1 Kdo hydroxylase family protein [Ramlibacter sp.]